ncbi:DUF4190 domain-containing protein [Rhodococcus sp. 114MFTsu3.1]|uniref:DUF4190 domain-containing protein n=1 Tax=Rhodococcus sp. 114MFTsu3.1 TaxID=1172184 RepID=UPI0003A54DD9|nr:DUF4190 domain-containing protein [Rhodococcus sp. 114MFTsu3.1]
MTYPPPGDQQPGNQPSGDYPRPPGDYPPPPGNYPPPASGYPPPPGNYPTGEYQPGGYQSGGYQQPGQYPPSTPKNTLGTMALVAAIIGVLTFWSVVGGIILGLLAVALGFVARSRVKKGAATNGTVSLVAIILGFVAAALSVALIAFGVSWFSNVGGQEFVDCMNDAGSSQSAKDQCSDRFQQNIEDRYR